MTGPGVLAALAAAARGRPDAPALHHGELTLSWAELDARAARVAQGLSADGIGPGDRVALVLPNGWRFAVALLGALGAGATVTPLNPMLSADERARTLADLGPRRVLEA